MPKTIKEVYTDYTGYTTVEYSDDSTRKYSVDDVPTVQSNPLTGGLVLSAGGARSRAGQTVAAATEIVVGDSITAQMYAGAGTPSSIVDNGNGTATISFVSSHGATPGCRIVVFVAPERKFNVVDGLVTAVQNSNPYTVTYQLGSRTTPVTGPIASTVMGYINKPSCLGWPVWKEFVVGSRINFVLAATYGADSVQALEMLQGAVADNGPTDSVSILIGTNDVYSRQWSYAQIVENFTALMKYAVSLNVPITWFSIPPRKSTTSGWTAGTQLVHNQVNAWLYSACQRSGIKFVDSARTVVNGVTFMDSAATNPDPVAAFCYDGLHTANVGGFALASGIPASIKSLFPAPYVGSHSTQTVLNNKFTNPRLTGAAGTKTAGSGTINGTVPNSWEVAITSGTPSVTLTSPARTIAADGDADGNNLQAVFSYSGTGTQTMQFKQTGLHSAVTAGTLMDIEIPVSITGASGMITSELIIFGVRAAVTENFGALVGISEALSGSLSGVMRVKDWLVPPDLSSLQVFARFSFSSGGATIVFGKPRFVPAT